MGNRNSFLAPTEEDLNYKGAAMSPGLSASLPGDKKPPVLVFQLPKQAWWRDEVTEIEELGVKLEMVGEKKDHCLVYYPDPARDSADKEQQTPVAVLREPANTNHRPLQILVPTPPSPGTSQPVTKFQGMKLYEYATVAKDGRQFVMQLVTAGDETHAAAVPSWRTDACRSATDDWILHLVVAPDEEGRNSRDRNPSKKPLVAAHVRQLPKRTWGVRVASGVDPLLVLCAALCADRWRNLQDARIRAASGVKGVYHPDVFKSGT